MNKKSIKDIDVKGKRVLMRVDFNVPLDKQQNVTDDNRIRAALPTIKYILDNNAKLILMSHLGRPKGEVKPEYSLKPAAEALRELINKPVKMLSDCIGKDVHDAVSQMSDGEVVMLENLRFHKEETANESAFAEQLASLGDVFVNDAFGTSHRAHASTEGVTHYLESVSGLLVEKEIEYFQKVLTNPDKPFIFLLGGAKVADKIPVIENMMDRASTIIIGGAMAYTFMKAQNINIGSSRFEQEMMDTAKAILQKAREKGVEIVLPIDHVVTDNIEAASNIKITDGEAIEEGFMGVDIGPKTINLFIEEIKTAKTIVWNGPVGIFENDKFANGTKALAGAIAESEAVSVIGGGDTAAAVAKFDTADKMSHISTGGGASLEYLEGRILPGVAALSNKSSSSGYDAEKLLADTLLNYSPTGIISVPNESQAIVVYSDALKESPALQDIIRNSKGDSRKFYLVNKEDISAEALLSELNIDRDIFQRNVFTQNSLSADQLALSIAGFMKANSIKQGRVFASTEEDLAAWSKQGLIEVLVMLLKDKRFEIISDYSQQHMDYIRTHAQALIAA